jgi:glutamine amidotransferase
LQLLFDVSYEDGRHEGLGIIPGDVVRFDSAPGLKIPHMGWNAIEFERPSPLLEGISSGDHVYFVHSYHVRPRDAAVVAAWTAHGAPFVSIIQRGQLFATQFHPEKSQRVGLRLLENFARL